MSNTDRIRTGFYEKNNPYLPKNEEVEEFDPTDQLLRRYVFKARRKETLKKVVGVPQYQFLDELNYLDKS